MQPRHQGRVVGHIRTARHDQWKGPVCQHNTQPITSQRPQRLGTFAPPTTPRSNLSTHIPLKLQHTYPPFPAISHDLHADGVNLDNADAVDTRRMFLFLLLCTSAARAKTRDEFIKFVGKAERQTARVRFHWIFGSSVDTTAAFHTAVDFLTQQTKVTTQKLGARPRLFSVHLAVGVSDSIRR